MLGINIVCVGRLKEPYLKAAVDEYAKRLSAYCRLNIIELAEYKLPQNPSESEIAKCVYAEGAEIETHMRGFKVAMCVEGKELSSEAFAKQIADASLHRSEISFAIGGSYGLSESVKEKADLRLSVSPMTFPHQLFRVILAEQIYRGFQIIANGKYHK